jgi:hypothetical protein
MAMLWYCWLVGWSVGVSFLGVLGEDRWEWGAGRRGEGYPNEVPTLTLAARRPLTLMMMIIKRSWIVQKGMRTRLSHGEGRGGFLVEGGIMAGEVIREEE